MPYHQDDGPPMFTYTMMAVFIAFFGAQFKSFDLTKFYAFPWRVAHGELWRLITSTFLHGSIIHILFNVVLFFRFSRVVDNWMGPWGAMLLYVMFSASSSAAQLLVAPGPGSIGASGAVYGLFGFLWVMRRRRDDAGEAANQHTVQTMLAWLAICAVLNMFGGNIANTAHIWGLLLGWLLGQTFVAVKQNRAWMVVATIAVFVLPIALSQKAVYTRTLGAIPWVRTLYSWDLEPDAWETVEHWVTQRPPEVF